VEGGVRVADTQVVELELPDGGIVLVRAEQLEDETGGGPSNIGPREALSFDAVSSTLRGVAANVHEAVKAVKPDVASVEFGFELAVKGGRVLCLLTDGSAKATLNVRMEWRKGGLGDGQ
jgi:hypothetical protein